MKTSLNHELTLIEISLGHCCYLFCSNSAPCGGELSAAADVLLWKDKKTSAVVIGGATVIWVLFEVLDYHLLTLISHVLIGVLATLFLWSKATTFIKKSPPDIPVVQVSEDLVVNVSRALRNDINRALHLFREIAMGHDLKKFLGVCLCS
ncbi:Reticulon [Zea mays]|uniref:Reticulon-like protein n=1 Tax=Zea mays TaxID=4577 RepID=A0A1D6LXZ1_MAIZE|nr:Reticulon [Zea mays]AQK84023.1 Reticulon [Zea mays]